MNWPWANSLDQIWRSPGFPMWLTLAAAGFFGVIVLITLLRAEKSVANGALTVITLLAVGIAVAATIRGFGFEQPRHISGNPIPPADDRCPAGVVLCRRSGRGGGSDLLRESVVRLGGVGRRGAILCGLANYPADSIR